MESLYGLEFETVNEARTAVNAVALPLGFNLVIHRPMTNSKEFRCSKGRTFKSQGNASLPASRRRKTSSQMTGCPFRLVIARLTPVSPWKIRCSQNDKANKHNHELLLPTAHSKNTGI